MRNAILGVLLLTAGAGCDPKSGVPVGGQQLFIYRLTTTLVEDDTRPAAITPPSETVAVWVRGAESLQMHVPMLRSNPIGATYEVEMLNGDASDDEWHCGAAQVDTLLERRGGEPDLSPAVIEARATLTFNGLPATDPKCAGNFEWPTAAGHTVADLHYEQVEECPVGCNALASTPTGHGLTCGCPPGR